MTEEKSNVGKQLLHVAIDSIDLEKLAFGIIDRVLEPALDELVAGTETKFDDLGKAAIYAPLELALKDLISKEVAKLKAAAQA